MRNNNMLISVTIMTIFSSLRVLKIPQGEVEDKGVELRSQVSIGICHSGISKALFSILKWNIFSGLSIW